MGPPAERQRADCPDHRRHRYPQRWMYVPSNDSWVTAGATTQTLPVGTIGTTLVNEIGPAVTLPDGRVFFVGGTGRTQLYTSGSTSTAMGSWAAGPSLPTDSGNPLSPAGLQTVLDGAAAVLPNGRVLVTGGPTISSNGFWSSPVTIYEFDSGANTLTALANQPSNAPSQTWQTSLLLLPNGHVLMTGEQNSIGEYIPDSTELTPKASWRPVLTAVPTALITGHTYAIAGRQLTGLTQATGYGDDRQNATNYPLVRLTNSAGDVRYLRTTDFSTLGIATGNATVTAALQVPPGIPPGAWNLSVVADGIASTPTPVSIGTRDCFLIMDRSTAARARSKRSCSSTGLPRSSLPRFSSSSRASQRASSASRRQPRLAAVRPVVRATGVRADGRTRWAGRAGGPLAPTERAAAFHLPVRSVIRGRGHVRLHRPDRGSHPHRDPHRSGLDSSEQRHTHPAKVARPVHPGRRPRPQRPLVDQHRHARLPGNRGRPPVRRHTRHHRDGRGEWRRPSSNRC